MEAVELSFISNLLSLMVKSLPTFKVELPLAMIEPAPVIDALPPTLNEPLL
jgi:hypothetical protein